MLAAWEGKVGSALMGTGCKYAAEAAGLVDALVAEMPQMLAGRVAPDEVGFWSDCGGICDMPLMLTLPPL